MTIEMAREELAGLSLAQPWLRSEAESNDEQTWLVSCLLRNFHLALVIEQDHSWLRIDWHWLSMAEAQRVAVQRAEPGSVAGFWPLSLALQQPNLKQDNIFFNQIYHL